MANYVDSTVFINGSKRAIVDLLNKGLKNNKLSLRVSARMPGEQIASLLAELDREHCLATFSFLPHPKTFDHWDTTNKMLDFTYWCKQYGTTAHPHPEEAYRKYVRGYRRAVAYQKKKYGVVGGYDWNVKHRRSNVDISLPGGFQARWNLENDKIWAINPKSFEEVGCIHTAQGLATPRSSGSRPVRTWRRVVLPAPLSPSRAMRSPPVTWSSRSRNRVLSP